MGRQVRQRHRSTFNRVHPWPSSSPPLAPPRPPNRVPRQQHSLSRDRHAHYVSALALISALCEKIALEIRHLQRTEVREAQEPFT